MRLTREGIVVKQVSTRIPRDLAARLAAYARRQRMSVDQMLAAWIVPRIQALRER